MNYLKIFRDGDSWCALLGDNLQEGFAGFGGSPREAIENLLRESVLENWNWAENPLEN